MTTPRPVLVRLAASLACACVAFGLLATAAAASRSSQARPALSPLEAGIVAEINEVRGARGLASLRPSPGLQEAETAYVGMLAAQGIFTHGSSPQARIGRFYGGEKIGETLLWRSNGLSPEQAVALWLASPPHRAILLSPAFRHIGVAARAVEDAPGAYGGLDVTIVAAAFGAP